MIEHVLYTHILYPKLGSMTLGTALVLKWSVCNREVISVVHQVQGDIPKLSINLELISLRRTSCGLVFTVIRDKVSRRTSRVPVIARSDCIEVEGYHRRQQTYVKWYASRKTRHPLEGMLEFIS